MKPKGINVKEVVRELDIYDLEDETLVGYEDCIIDVAHVYHYGEPIYTIKLIKTRPETDEEYDKRLANAKKAKEKKLAAKGKKLEAENKEYERLKKKFGGKNGSDN